MSDQPVVHIGENSPEQVAYKLAHDIGVQENLYDNFSRKDYLDLYAECLKAVAHHRRL